MPGVASRSHRRSARCRIDGVGLLFLRERCRLRRHQTCQSPPPFITCPPLPGGLCAPTAASGPTDCCEYDASASDFQAQFESALSEIARRLLDSCVFDVPRGTDPSSFSPDLVNVGVTFDGEMRTVLRQGSDSSMSSWSYTDDSDTSIIIQGPICDRLLSGDSANVEIVLGCPTILI